MTASKRGFSIGDAFINRLSEAFSRHFKPEILLVSIAERNIDPKLKKSKL